MKDGVSRERHASCLIENQERIHYVKLTSEEGEIRSNINSLYVLSAKCPSGPWRFGDELILPVSD